MQIEHSVTLTIGDTDDPTLLLKKLTPFDEATKSIIDIYATQKSWGAEMPNMMKYPCQDVVIAIGVLEKGESDLGVALSNACKDGWYPASLIHWNYYKEIHSNKIHSVAIMGTICRDDNFYEWMFTISHKKIFGIKNLYEISAKQWVVIRHKSIPVLLVKMYQKKI